MNTLQEFFSRFGIMDIGRCYGRRDNYTWPTDTNMGSQTVIGLFGYFVIPVSRQARKEAAAIGAGKPANGDGEAVHHRDQWPRPAAPADDADATLVDPSSATETAAAEAPTNAWDPQNVTGFFITHLYSSLMVRAVTTGSIIAEALGLPLVAWETIHEEGGIYLDDEVTGEPVGQPGYRRAYYQERFPNFVLPDGKWEGGWWNRPFEAYEDHPRRAQRFLQELLERHGGSQDRVAIVSHGGFYNLFLREVLHLPAANGQRPPWLLMNNAAITRLDFTENGVDLVYTNRAHFLP